MPRYFFDVHDGVSIIDDEGTELADEHAARIAAAQLAGRLLADHPSHFWDGGEWRIVVRGERGAKLFGLAFVADS